jgi:hypothetical protein
MPTFAHGQYTFGHKSSNDIHLGLGTNTQRVINIGYNITAQDINDLIDQILSDCDTIDASKSNKDPLILLSSNLYLQHGYTKVEISSTKDLRHFTEILRHNSPTLAIDDLHKPLLFNDMKRDEHVTTTPHSEGNTETQPGCNFVAQLRNSIC